MTLNNISTTTGYAALTVVSPLMFGDDRKDQDRALWNGPGQTACVCDGVSSSPDSAEAAKLVTLLVPALFNGNANERLAMLCDLLMIRRLECQNNNTVSFPDNTSPAMQDILRRVVQQKRASSFQTTIVVAKFITDEQEKVVLADVLKCGDSAFFAFTSQGQLLTSSLAFPSKLQNSKEHPGMETESSTCPKNISFGPGDEILIRVEGLLCEYRSLAEQAEIKAEHARNWLVCTPVDGCRDDDKIRNENLLDLQVLSLKSTDRLLVPKYLYGRQLTCQDRQYRVLRYSSTIRPILAKESLASIISFSKHSSSTMVLPDHFYSNCFDSFQDRFPLQTHFILCSDGFYSSFSCWQQLWTWLQENSVGLNNNTKRNVILEKLHANLHAKSSDDDISFVWVHPNIQSQPDTEGGDNLCQQKL
jgi:serine/threonine protein phosphatase PrpC